MLKFHLFSYPFLFVCVFVCLLFSILVREPLICSSREDNIMWLWKEESFSLPKMLQELGNKKKQIKVLLL